jgi:hypothetical protein
MQHDDERIVGSAALDPAAIEKALLVPARVGKFDDALRSDEEQNNPKNAQEGTEFSSSVKPAVKPGPSAVSNARFHGGVPL